MSGVSITTRFHDVNRLNRFVERLGAMDKEALVSGIGAKIETQTHRRLSDEKTNPDGTPWAPWSDEYAKTRHSGQSLLMSEGDLDDTIQSIIRGEEVETGSNLPYAAIQQFGGEEIGRPGHPAREYLGFSDDDWNDIATVVDDFLDDLMQGAMQ